MQEKIIIIFPYQPCLLLHTREICGSNLWVRTIQIEGFRQLTYPVSLQGDQIVTLILQNIHTVPPRIPGNGAETCALLKYEHAPAGLRSCKVQHTVVLHELQKYAAYRGNENPEFLTYQKQYENIGCDDGSCPPLAGGGGSRGQTGRTENFGKCKS